MSLGLERHDTDGDNSDLSLTAWSETFSSMFALLPDLLAMLPLALTATDESVAVSMPFARVYLVVLTLVPDAIERLPLSVVSGQLVI